jgi:hypothetical protein
MKEEELKQVPKPSEPEVRKEVLAQKPQPEKQEKATIK